MLKHFLCLSAVAGLAACGGSSTSNSGSGTVAVDGVVKLSNGSFELTQSGTTVTLPATGSTSNSMPLWFNASSSSGTVTALAYESADVLAVGGTIDGTPMAGITGTEVAPPSVNTSYDGRIAYVQGSLFQNQAITLTYDANANTVSGASTSATVAGTMSGNEMSGTVTVGSNTAAIEGGFYGTDEVAGSFSGSAFGGVFFGIETP